MAVKQIGPGSTDGIRIPGPMVFFSTTATPVAQQSVALTTTTATTATNEAAISAIITALQNLGLFA